MINVADRELLSAINQALLKLKVEENKLLGRVEEVRVLAREYRLQKQALKAKIEDSGFPSSIGPGSLVDLPSSRSSGV